MIPNWALCGQASQCSDLNATLIPAAMGPCFSSMKSCRKNGTPSWRSRPRWRDDGALCERYPSNPQPVIDAALGFGFRSGADGNVAGDLIILDGATSGCREIAVAAARSDP